MDRFKLVFFAPALPPATLAQIKSAIFATGAGQYEKYSECCFQTPGIGQFRPSADANPAIGTAGGEVEQVGEVRLEVLCGSAEIVRKAVEALKKIHPYEEVAYDVYKLEDF
ncbi:adenosine deaminase [Polychaeton citri CBS 116435]|uniref:ATP phosphoribosyltransferase n=1 Tax=Polychaeton citri CBS 116435 TaxID=1314669 RepID=A0A9P4Q1H2_9PEZI|nr:adenosine deaminase [Polychaeton citri CBS 116435]